jgi:Tfp pilus assembly protein PilF
MQEFKLMNTVTKEWLKYEPNELLAWLYHGVSWQGMGNKEEACRAYRKGLKINPRHSFLKKMVKKLGC